MSNVRSENLGLSNGIELFLHHWKYGKDWKSSTVLTDAQYNVIAFFDRGTENIDRIELFLPFNGGFIIKDGKPIKTDKMVKYVPYDYEMMKREWDLIRRKHKLSSDDAGKLLIEMKGYLKDYNKYYFTDLNIGN